MSVYWDAKKSRWRIEITRGGQRFRKIAPPGATRAEAEQFEAKIIRGHWLGELGKTPEYTIDQGVYKYLTEEVIHHKAEADTQSVCRTLIPHITGRKLADIATVADEIKAAHKTLKPATINRKLSVLRRVANLAYKRWGWISEPLGTKIQLLPERNARHVYLSWDEFLALLIAADKPHTEAAILAGVFTGMRLSEIVSIKPDMIRNATIYLPTSKTDQPRAIPMHTVLADIEWPLGVGKSAIQHCFDRAKTATGLTHVHFHDLRHTSASWLVQAGVPLYTAGALLGHASTKTTQRYAHLADQNLRDAVGKMVGKK